MRCPYCRHPITRETLFCLHCGQEVYAASSAQEPPPSPQDGEPPSTLAANELVGRTCPYDQFPIASGDEVLVCPECRTVHHVDCWRENGGCTTLGCSYAPRARAAAAHPAPRLGPPPSPYMLPRPPELPPGPTPAIRVARAETENRATTALVLSLAGLCTCCPIFAVIGFFLGLQVYMASSDRITSTGTARVRAVWAMIVGVIAPIVWVVFFVAANQGPNSPAW